MRSSNLRNALVRAQTRLFVSEDRPPIPGPRQYLKSVLPEAKCRRDIDEWAWSRRGAAFPHPLGKPSAAKMDRRHIEHLDAQKPTYSDDPAFSCRHCGSGSTRSDNQKFDCPHARTDRDIRSASGPCIQRQVPTPCREISLLGFRYLSCGTFSRERIRIKG
jgi:hypothetical protein